MEHKIVNISSYPSILSYYAKWNFPQLLTGRIYFKFGVPWVVIFNYIQILKVHSVSK